MKLAEPARSVDPATDTEPPIWPDLMTPLSRASRRRWSVMTVAVCALLGGAFVASSFDRAVAMAVPFMVFAWLIGWSMLLRSTRAVAKLNATGLDEREMASRGDAFRTAFVLLLACAVGSIAVLGAFAAAADADVSPRGLATAAGWIVMWAGVLPTIVLAWREPDALELDEDRQLMPELLRDGLVAGSVVVGLAVCVFVDPMLGLLAYAVPGTLWLLSTRVPGEPLLSWREIVAILFVLWLFGPTLLFY